MSSLLADELKEYKDKELEKLVAMIIKTSERSIHLIRDFVKQEFLSSANSVFKKRRVNIVKKIEESIEQYNNSEKDIEKIFKFSFSHKRNFYGSG
ncbi:MAG: hypothetical protein WD426_13860 [Anditalea sp.]